MAGGSFGGGDGSAENPYLVEDAADLKAIEGNMSAHYKQVTDFTLGQFEPIGNPYLMESIEFQSDYEFSGDYDGDGHYTCDGEIYYPNIPYYIGIFAVVSGKIKNLGVKNVKVTGGGVVGGLVGYNEGTITNCYTTGKVTGSGSNIGGLVGNNETGTISSCYTGGDVTGESSVGGLVGYSNTGTSIIDCHASGDIVGSGYGVGGLVGISTEGEFLTDCYSSGVIKGRGGVGGLVGENTFTISNCHSTGEVVSEDNESSYSYGVGGLIGVSYGKIDNCYSSGRVTGFSGVGGLIGENRNNIYNCHSTGEVVGVWLYAAGGLVGANEGGNIDDCYAIGGVTGILHDPELAAGRFYAAGGLVGSNNMGVITRSCSTGAVVSEYAVGGLVGDDRNSSITDCYALGSIAGTFWAAGGLVGSSKDGVITRSYSVGRVDGNYDVGGFIGYEDNVIFTTCYFDSETSGYETSGQPGTLIPECYEYYIVNGSTHDEALAACTFGSTPPNATPKTTIEMKQKITFIGWDFNKTWHMREYIEYPLLIPVGSQNCNSCVVDAQEYLSLITSEHYGKINFTSFLATLIAYADDIVCPASNFDCFFDITNVTGSRLDILGEIVGVVRTVNFQPSDGSSPALDDNTFRLIIKAKIARNQWDGTIQQIPILWSNLFPQYELIVIDNQDMSIIALVYGFLPGVQKDLIENGYIIPKPQGVKINYGFIYHPAFSYGLDNELFKGYEAGCWTQLS